MIRALIADDEEPARRKLRDLLAAEPDVDVAGEAHDGAEAVTLLRDTRLDLVFLDVQMPRLDGFEVIEQVGLRAMPLTVFVTAYDEHALRAFEVHALDYLLKPFAPTRFRAVLARVRAQLTGGAQRHLSLRIDRLLDSLGPGPRYLRHVLAQRGKDRECLLAVDAIDRIQADRNYLRFFTAEGEFLRRGTLGALVERLDPQLFLRINRSEVVRLDAVRELRPWFHGDRRVVLKDGTTLTWSRRFRGRDDQEF